MLQGSPVINLRAEWFTINHKAKLNRNDWIKALLPRGMKCQLHQLQWSWIKLNSWCGIQTNDIWKIHQHQCCWCSGRTASTRHNVYWGNEPKAEWTKAAPPHKAHFKPEWNLSTSQYDANQHRCCSWKIWPWISTPSQAFVSLLSLWVALWLWCQNWSTNGNQELKYLRIILWSRLLNRCLCSGTEIIWCENFAVRKKEELDLRTLNFHEMWSAQVSHM